MGRDPHDARCLQITWHKSKNMNTAKDEHTDWKTARDGIKDEVVEK